MTASIHVRWPESAPGWAAGGGLGLEGMPSLSSHTSSVPCSEPFSSFKTIFLIDGATLISHMALSSEDQEQPGDSKTGLMRPVQHLERIQPQGSGASALWRLQSTKNPQGAFPGPVVENTLVQP